MIQFACHCRHVFTLNDDEAGGLAQCPQCGRLNDVPTLGELGSLADDGTIKVGGDPPPKEAHRLTELELVYRKSRTDAEGNEIDLRTSLGDIIMPPPLELEPAEPTPAPPKPRYDPVSGELIRPIEVQPDEQPAIDPGSVPMARPAINYATRFDVRRVSIGTVPVELFAPLNMVVLIFLYAAHVALKLLLQLPGIIPLFVFPVVVFLIVSILSHYGNTIEEVGPDARDELPRPLRDLRLHEDIWSPLVNVLEALALSYGPTVLIVTRLNIAPPAQLIFAFVAFVLGTVFFPAVLLTTTTSGTPLNLRPDRLLAVIMHCGSAYIVSVALWSAAAVLTAWGLLIGIRLGPLSFAAVGTAGRWPVLLMSLAAGVYLMHWFCWQVGLLYRAHHESFPWVLQRHISTREEQIAAATADHEAASRTSTKARLRALRETERRESGRRL